MNPRLLFVACCAIALLPANVRAQAPAIDTEPVLRVIAGGPTAFVTSLTFGATEQDLYASGYDKVLHSWSLDRNKKFVASNNTYRVPIGPGIDGAVNGIAVSPDGNWLAAGGRSMIQHGGTAGFRQLGIWIDSARSMSAEMWEDQGTIYVFDTRTGAVQLLRGHRGQVLSLAFADSRPGKPPLLASVAREFNGKGYVGAVRLWDVAQGIELDRELTLPDIASGNRLLWPRLALWHTGEGAKQVRVALAWEDGNFRVWDLERANDRIVSKADGDFNNPIAHLPGTDQVLTTSFTANKGALKLWNTAGKSPTVVKQSDLGADRKPRALAVFSDGGAKLNRVALIVEVPAAAATVDYFLEILDLADFKAVRAPHLLWNGGRMQPALAISPGSRYLAAAGNKDHQVQVFALADLLQKQDVHQTLRGSGTTISTCAFVKNGPNLGLLLTEAGSGVKAAGGELVFDITRRTLSADRTGWKADAPATETWDIQRSAAKDVQGRPIWQLAVVQNNQPVGAIRLKSGQFPTAQAILPPSARIAVPILAVAHVEFGQTFISLYNARTGEHVRQLTGHVNNIHSLAFASNGRLLVSAAEDQLVCVWSMNGLSQMLGSRAQLRGLIVAERAKGDGLAVAQLDKNSLLAENLKTLTDASVQEGDVIEAFVAKGKVTPLTTLRQFYDSIILLKPGADVTLRIAKRGDISLTVGQGIDEHKPLLSLFITRGGRAQDRRWIGWNPVGPYDASDRDAEKLLGWHKNTGDPKKPATFALAQAHRDANYKQDILKYLVEEGNAGGAIDAWKKDHPEKPREAKMTLWIKELGPEPATDNLKRIKLEDPQVTLMLSVHELTAGKVDGVRWQLDDGPRGEFEQGDGNEWSASMGNRAWVRGPHKIRVTLKTAAPDAHEFFRELQVNYQPPAPVVKATGALPRVVDKAEYRFQAEVLPPRFGTVRASLTHRHEGKEIAADAAIPIKGRTAIDKTLKLLPGINQIKLLAQNTDAPAGTTTEADWLEIEVLYKSPKPQISLSSVQTVPDGEMFRIDLDRADRPLVVDVPRVRIVGEIEALEKLHKLAYVLGDRRTPLASEGKTRQAIEPEVLLTEPGKPQKVRFTAKTATSEEAERSVVLEYQPRLPELRLTSPVDGQPLFAGKDSLNVKVEGRLTWPTDRQPCTAELLVNGKPQGELEKLNGKAQNYSAKATLQPGENTIQVRLKNEWRENVTARVLVSYRRPPVIVAVKAPPKSIKPFADVLMQVESPNVLPLTHVKIKGRELSAETVRPMVIEKKGESSLFEVAFKELALQGGSNQIELQAGNADGWSAPQTVQIEVEKQMMEPRAEVSLLNLQQDTVVETTQFSLELQVRSQSKVKKVEIERNGEKVFSKTDLADQKAGPDGVYVVRLTEPLVLAAGSNSIKVIAENGGGEQSSRTAVVTYQFEPVRVRIEYLKVADKAVPPSVVLGDGVLFFKVGEEQVLLQGQVQWGPQSDAQVKKATRVRVCVNGCLQAAAVLEPAKEGLRVRSFQSEVRLTRAAGNHIEVKLPEVVQELGSRSQCLVDCAKPATVAETKRQAHLLIVDTGTRDDEISVTQRIYQALGATPAATPNRFNKVGFGEGGRLYGPLVGEDVTPERVYMQLLSIKKTLQRRVESGSLNDVVFVYFRGGETIDAGGHFLRTSDSARDPELRWSGIPTDYLMRFFAENLGAQIVLLDVTRELPAKGTAQAKDRVAFWPEDPNVAVVRYAWNGSAQNQDDGARLINDWRDAVAQKQRLKDITETLGNKFAEGGPKGSRPSRKYQGLLTLFEQLPQSMQDFAIGRP